jgi:serine phosphatase RsbU (regulator of sigma subunit)
MELVTNSSDDTIMMALTDKTVDVRRAARGNHVPQAGPGANEEVALHRDFVENAQFVRDELDALRRDQAKLQQAIFEAAQIQRRLCAPRARTWGEFEVAGEIFPVRHLSGDFFKVMELGTSLGVVLGDIAGKGLTAGIWQAHLMALIQRSARQHLDPAVVVAEVNHELCHDDGQPPLTALFFARIDQQTNQLAYCNAGLPAPLLLRSNKAVENLKEGGPMLGALKGATFQTGIVTLHQGDTLVAYSDGVTECRNVQDNEFEMERLTAAAMAVTGVCATKALFSLLGTVLDFADSCSPGDDLTILVLRRRGAIRTEQASLRTKDCSAPHRRPTSASRLKNTGRGGRSPK